MRYRPRFNRPAVVAAVVVLSLMAGPAGAAKPPGAGGGGKPGYPDRVMWSGYTWQVKTSTTAVGPGPNVFAKENVSVSNGELRLEIALRNGRWTAAEIIAPTTLGYGTYTFTIASNLTTLDPNAVLGLFTWSDRARFAHREIDIEVARWGDPGDPTNAQFVVQPWDAVGHLERYLLTSTGETVHSFTWRPGRVDFESAGYAWSYGDSGVPPSLDERVRLNLWLFGGQAPIDGRGMTVVVRSFSFTPLPAG